MKIFLFIDFSKWWRRFLEKKHLRRSLENSIVNHKTLKAIELRLLWHFQGFFYQINGHGQRKRKTSSNLTKVNKFHKILIDLRATSCESIKFELTFNCNRKCLKFTIAQKNVTKNHLDKIDRQKIFFGLKILPKKNCERTA